MIYTMTANPSLDYIMRLPEFIPGATNRAKETELFAGGKGINVSTILARLGHVNTALGLIAGFSGKKLSEMLEERPFGKDFIQCEGYTRINVKLKAGVESEINGTGLRFTQREINALCAKVSVLKKGDVLILSGSIPEGLDSTFYRSLMEQAGSEVLTVVDATGALLKNTLELHPFLIKPNQAELEEFFGQSLQSPEQIAKAAQKLQKLGARNVLISRGSQGAMLAGMDGRVWIAGCPQGKLVNSVGSGDSMVAGFVAGWLDTGSLEQAFVQSIYCGSATAFCADLAEKHDIETLQETSPIKARALPLDKK